MQVLSRSCDTRIPVGDPPPSPPQAGSGLATLTGVKVGKTWWVGRWAGSRGPERGWRRGIWGAGAPARGDSGQREFGDPAAGTPGARAGRRHAATRSSGRARKPASGRGTRARAGGGARCPTPPPRGRAAAASPAATRVPGSRAVGGSAGAERVPGCGGAAPSWSPTCASGSPNVTYGPGRARLGAGWPWAPCSRREESPADPGDLGQATWSHHPPSHLRPGEGTKGRPMSAGCGQPRPLPRVISVRPRPG